MSRVVRKWNSLSVRCVTDSTVSRFSAPDGLAAAAGAAVGGGAAGESGQMLAATALLTATPKPSEQQITDGMNSNICRCATYHRIRGAVARASEIMG